MESKQLSIEVFRDFETPDVSTESAEQAIGLLEGYTNNIALTAMRRMVKIGAKSTLPEINSIRFPYSAMTTDMNLILTGRMFSSHNPNVVRGGISQRHVMGNTVKRVAIISVPSNEHPDITVAHELGHLLNLKSKGDTHDGSGHCLSPDCMMHAIHEETVGDDLAPATDIFSKFTKRVQRRSDTNNESRPYEQMCSECAQQLGENAFWLLRAKNGLALPPGYSIY